MLTSAFNPILVLFSLDLTDTGVRYYELSILYWFYFLLLKNKTVMFPHLLSILYWFYFLFNTAGWQIKQTDFQSYIGSIFSGFKMLKEEGLIWSFNPILVLFSPDNSFENRLNSVFQSYIGSIFSRRFFDWDINF